MERKTKNNRDSFLNKFKQFDKQELDINCFTSQLKDFGQTSKKKLNEILNESSKIFNNQPNMLKLVSPLRIVGDIHGQFYDLLYIFQNFGTIGDHKYLFLGDYVDRGLFCIQVMTLLLALKCKYPKQIYLLRGNHQGKTMTQSFNFKLECCKKYDADIYDKFLDLFCQLPLCALIDQKYFAVHGGISPELKKIKQLDTLNRFKQIDQSGLICDLLWSDPNNTNNSLWERNKARSCSYYFSKKQASKFLNDNNIKLIIRGHQVQMNGFNYQTGQYRQKLTLTIFSAPNYCDTYSNKASIGILQKNNITIQKFSQSVHPFVFTNYMNVVQWSLPTIANNMGKLFMHLLKSTAIKSQNNSQQQNVLNRLQFLNKYMQNKQARNLSLLFEKNNIEQQNSCLQQAFSFKKINDHCQKYPEYKFGPSNPIFVKVKMIEAQDDQFQQIISVQQL